MDRPEDKAKPAGPGRFGLLSERTRRLELAFFSGLLALLAAVLLWSGWRFLDTGEAYSGVLPFTIDGVPALVLGAVHLLTGAGILVATWAMWRLFR